jgi:hypothetical protein
MQSGLKMTVLAVSLVDAVVNCESIRFTREDRSKRYVATSDTSRPITTREMTPTSSRPLSDSVIF